MKSKLFFCKESSDFLIGRATRSLAPHGARLKIFESLQRYRIAFDSDPPPGLSRVEFTRGDILPAAAACLNMRYIF